MSAALSYVYDCSGGMKHYTNDTSMINETMSGLDNLLNYTSNALSMVVAYDLYGNETESWRLPRTERDGFWERGSPGQGRGSIGAVPMDSKVDAVVCKDGANGCYKTVQEAVDAAPSNLSDTKFVIRIKEGVYEEIVRVPFDKKNVVFLGDGRNKTVITGSLTVATPGVTTYDSATVGW